ncbi:plastocyanin/azurin family copper-binding protein [Halosegnis marinus]|uniref:Plastocyanin/azurin family copper-binding protein n=2 Tax=Halosegnis marinus TaxID=3034023 RepID=A0ABD5ZRE2_9EURY|nr:plastocyanin/azurin family copper-binding protein [Halosegnis sp. DT85]
MNRREFLRTAGGATAVAGAVSASGSAAAQSGGPEVALLGSLVFDPAEVYVSPGTTVTWVWESDGHNIVVDSQPEGANWEGTEGGASQLYDTGYEYSHTFEELGEYEYVCAPHRQAGMVGTVVVNESGAPPSGGGGEVEPEEMGVPIQAHFVGIATILAIAVSLMFTFFLLKYGESPHASGGN